MAIRKFLLAAVLAAVCAVPGAGAVRQQLIDKDWQFSRDSVDWVSIDLPHDWSITGPYDKTAAANNDGGYLPTGKGFYSKTLHIPKVDGRQKYQLYFEGVYQNSKVYVNGHLAGGHPYGYSSFFVDITPFLKDGDNRIDVAVDNSAQRNCRWYSGSGIYRHVWLQETRKVHLDPWGLRISTKGGYGGITPHIDVKATIVNDGDEAKRGSLTVQVLDGEQIMTSVMTPQRAIEPGENSQSYQGLLPPVKAWSPDAPALYTARVSLLDAEGQVIDQIDQAIGFRDFEYSADGLKLNGEPLVLNGACVHHDNGILGASSYDAAEIRKARLLKDAGFNAVRASHNVPAPAFLDACDSIGLIVIDEAFDGWAERKTEHDYADFINDWWEKDVAAMVRRDRNHPSVMAWSIGNEVLERKSPSAVQWANKMGELCRELDPTRPVTSALAAWDEDWEIYDPLAGELDIVGYNYMIHKAPGDHERLPGRVMWQTESYPRDAYSNWHITDSLSCVIGDFVWTGLDYLGESGIGRHYYEGDPAGEHWERSLWPWHGAYCGDIDITGQRKPISHYRDMLWNDAAPIFMAVREPEGYKGQIKETMWGTYPTYQSWTWPGWEGKPIDVEVYSRAPEVMLICNGVVVDKKPSGAENKYVTTFTLPYERGIITAVAIVQGRAETTQLKTAGEAAEIRLVPDRGEYGADGQDVAFVIAEVVDAEGNVVAVADNAIDFTVSGPATILGSGSGDMKDTEPYATGHAKAWRGRVICAVRIDGPGAVTIVAETPGLPRAETILTR